VNTTGSNCAESSVSGRHEVAFNNFTAAFL